MAFAAGDQVGIGVELVCGVALRFFWELAQECIEIDAAQKAMRAKLDFGRKSRRLEEDQLFLFAKPGIGNQSIELPGMYADEFIFPQGNQLGGQGIDDKTVFKGRGFGCKLLFVDQMIGEVAVELVESFLIAGQTDVLLLGSVAEVDADHGMDAAFLRSTDKWKNPRRAVDIGECERIEFFTFRLSDQRFHRHRPVFEAEVRMAIEKHWRYELRSTKYGKAEIRFAKYVLRNKLPTEAR